LNRVLIQNINSMVSTSIFFLLALFGAAALFIIIEEMDD
jgi:hypothetical protein